MEVSEEALDRAEKILDERSDIRTCLKAGVCPECACDIKESEETYQEEPRFECTNCMYSAPRKYMFSIN